MANNKIQFKRTTISGRTPNTTNSGNTSYIDAGEFAVNLTDQKVYSSNGSVSFEVGANLASLNVQGNVTIGGNLQVNGTTISISGNNLSITDNMLYLNNGILASITNISGNGSVVTFTANNNFSAGWDVFVSGVTPSSYNGTYNNILFANSTLFTVSSNNVDSYSSGGTARGKTDANPDIGFAAGYNDGTYHHTGFFRDATDGRYKVFDSYLPEPDASAFIDTSNASFHIADFQANTLYANAIYANGSLGNTGQALVSNGTAVYWSNNPGYTGSAGPTGAQGPQGATGAQGPQGAQGSIGYTGSAGTNGYTGSAGTNGYTGSAGTNGYTGSKGDAGYTGSKGTTTIANTAPTSPISGDTWWNSDTGIRYVYYNDGDTSQWVQESAVGPLGYTGSAGSIGYTGSLGYTGSRGYTGSASTVAGPTGSTGPTGPQGPIGYTGSAGSGGGGGSGMVLVSNGNINMLMGYPKYLDFGATLYSKYILFLEDLVVTGLGSEYFQPNTASGAVYSGWIGTATTTIAQSMSNTATVYATSIYNSPYPPAPSPPQGMPVMGTPWNPNVSASMGYFNGAGYIVFESMNSSTAPFGSFFPAATGEFTYKANYSSPFSGDGMASDKISLRMDNSLSSNVTGLILQNISQGWYTLYGVPQ